MPILIWLVILGLVIFAYVIPSTPRWLPVIVYLIAVFVRAKEKFGNYRDWVHKNKRDEQLKLEDVAEDMASRGLALSSIREKEEKKVKDDFEFERREKKRRLQVELIDSLFLR